MRIGAHEPTSGGLHLALLHAEADGCEAVQIFSGFNTRWQARAISDEDASCFRSTAAARGLAVLSHAAYLINLASPEAWLWERSILGLEEELVRCATLGIPHVVVHPGAHMGQGPVRGLARVARAVTRLLSRTRGLQTTLLLENTAGQGSSLGATFAELGQILARVDTPPERLGLCVDTCHAHAAGYDLVTAKGYRAALGELARVSDGLRRVRAFHLNDARSQRGSRRDRHASIGEGTLGLAPFRRLVNEPVFADLPAVVETPADPDGRLSFARNVRTLKRLRRPSSAA